MKTKLFSNRKGISPLIATVLLIGFAIALGALVMNWGKSYVEEQITATDERYRADQECELYIDFDIKEIAGRPRLCYTMPSATTITINYTIENTATQIEGLRIIVYGQDDTSYTTGLNFSNENRSIAKGQSIKDGVAFSVASGFSLAQVEFIPKMNTTGIMSPTLCVKSKLTKSSIPTC